VYAAWVTRPGQCRPVLNAETREQVRAILYQSSRTVGQAARVWPLTRLANVCHEQGLSETPSQRLRCGMPLFA
jgi:hypothetical protein